MKAKNRKYIIYSIVLLVILGLSVGFSTLQKTLLIDDFIFNVRLQIDTRVSASLVSKTGGDAISNFEDYNVSKIYGNATFPTTSSYLLYKVDLTNYGNVKTGLLNITSNTSGISYSICDSNGNNCSNNPKTAVCNGNNCTLGSTKEIYVKVTSSSTGTKSIDLDLDFQPYHNISYENFNENINSFETEIMETDTYEITLTSNVEEVEVNGRGTASYNKNTHKLTISGVESDITINAKYLITDLAQTSYTGRDPDNYVSFNKGLFRIITKENINDGYGNTELRTKIVSNSSIGSNPYASNNNVTSFSTASISGVLEVYTRGISNESAQLIDTAQWTEDYVNNAGLISKTDAQNNISWWNSDQFTIELIPNGTSFLHKDSIIASNNNSKIKLVSQKNDNLLAAIPSTLYPIKAWGIASGSVGEILVNISLATYPSFYLHKDVLVVGGTGTSTNPYLLDIKGDSLKANPTIITGKTVTVTGSNQDIITVSNRIGTPYFGTTVLNESNYRTDGEAGVPRRSAVGTYTFYYYIPAVDGYKPRAGSVTARINGITYRINYTKGENISEIGKTSDSCTTTGTSLTCTVTLPTITPNAGWENGRWTDGRYNYNPGTSYTLNSSNSDGTLSSVVTGKTFIATIYYYNGSGTSSTTASCTVTSGSSCSFIRPNAVVNSTGVYNGGFLGLAGSMNTMAQSNSVLSDDTTYYALYTKNVTNYYYDGTSYTSRTLNRNEYFSTASTLVSKLALDDSTASNYSGENGVGNSTWLGLSTADDTTAEYNSVELAASSTVTTLYTIYQFSIEYQKGVNVSGVGATGGTCKVTSQNSCSVTLPSITPNTGYESVGWSSTSGALTGIPAGQSYSISVNSNTLYANAVGAIYTATFYYYDGNNINTATSSCTVSNVEGNCTVTVPSVVQNSTGPYNGTFNTASATSTMEPISLTINNNTSKFYANYKTSVTRYYYSSGYKTNTIYRNEYFINDSTMSSVLTTSDVGTTNYTTSRGPGSSNWLGLSTAQDTTIEYNSVSNAAQSTNTTFYTVYQFIVNFEKGTNVDSIGSSSSSCNVTTSDTSCTVIFPSITPNIGYTSVGWSMTNGDTIGEAALTTYTVTNNNRVFYANAIAANYLNTTTNDTYMTLSEALTAVSSNQTIKVLQNTTETTQATLSNTKTGVTLDLNNKTVTSSASECITNNGTITVSSGTLNCTSGTAITNAGTLTITSATIRGTYGISNGTNKTLNINGSSTQIVGTVYDGITTYGNVNVANGSISGNRYGIETLSSTVGSTTYYGNVYLTGGSISGIECGVKVASSSTLQLGTNDGNVSTTTPSIQATGTNGNYGIYMDSSSKLYFYDGVIKSSSGEGYSIYFSSEWYGVTVATNYADLCILNKETSNGIESATVVMGNYVVVSTNKGYKTLSSALSYIFDMGLTNQTIKVLQDVTETSSAQINRNGTKLDLNGHTITSSASPAIEVYNGTLEIYNSSSTTGVFESSGRYTIQNKKEFTTNVTNTTNNIIIRNTSTAANSRVLYNDSNSSATLNDNTTIAFTNPLAASTTRYLIQSSGTSLTIDGANLINNVDSSTYNAGISGNVTMTSGTITTTGVGIYGGGVIKGGTITSYNTAINSSFSTLTIGEDDGSVSTTSPLIQTLGTSNNYGISGSFYIYDGVIKSSSGTGYATSTVPSDVPSGYDLHKTTTGGVETAVLGTAVHNYLNTSTNEYYERLYLAFRNVENNQTIKVLQNKTENTIATLASGKTGVKLDLNGKTITSSTNPAITNNGTLDIYSSASGGVLESSSTNVINNTGTLTTNATSSTNSVTIKNNTTSRSTRVINNSNTNGIVILNTNTNIIFSNATESPTVSGQERYYIDNKGSVTINGAIFNYESSSITNDRGIYLSDANATLTMTNGSIVSVGYNLYNGTSTSLSAITISGGNITGSYGIYNTASGGVTISGGTVTGGVYNGTSGTVTVTGGTITGGSGIRNLGTLTVGTNDGTVSTSSPVIHGTGTSLGYGVNNNNGGTFYFYDGIIKSSSGTDRAITGTVSNTPTGYVVYKETINGVESAYLVNEHTYTATFYYNSNTTSGSLTVATTTASCTTASTSCTVTIPSVVTSSVGKYNSAYKGVSTSTGSMGSSSLTISADTTYYANYSANITNHYYSNNSPRTLYRNEWFNNTSSMITIIGSSNTSTTSFLPTEVGPESSTFVGYTVNENERYSYSDYEKSNYTTLYSVYSNIITFEKGANVYEINSSSSECLYLPTSTSCTVVLPLITPNDGYISVGWSTTNGDTIGIPEGTLYEATSTSTLYANAVLANYKNTSTNEAYQTLSEAFNAVSSNQTIKVLQNVTETSGSTLASGKTGVKLDLNGKTITSTAIGYAVISNFGTLDIYSSAAGGIIEGSYSVVISNNGTLTTNSTSSTYGIIIRNNSPSENIIVMWNFETGTMTLNSNTTLAFTSPYTGTSYRRIILNEGLVTINGATIIDNTSSSQLSMGIDLYNTSSRIIVNSGIINVSGRAIISSSTQIISPAITITGGTITSTNSEAISASTGKTIISGGTISGTSGIVIAGQLDISGSSTQISGTSSFAVQSSGTATIESGTLTSAMATAVYVSGGSTTITGGSIIGNYYGISLSNNATLTLGINDSSVSTTSPVVQTTGTSNLYGFYNYGGTFNFYDGVIKSSSGTGYAIYGTVSNTPTGYVVNKSTTSGVESAYLVEENSSLLKAGDAGDKDSAFLGTTILKKNIESITFTNSITGHTANGTNCFDVSVGNNGSVLVWAADNDSDGLYELTFGSSTGTVSASSGNNLFSYLTNLTSVSGLNYFDTSNATDLSYMFYGCSNLTSIDVSNFNTTNVTTLEKMFYNCTNLSNITGLANFDTAKVESLYGLFWNCENLITINGLANWNTSNVTTMRGVFGLDSNKEKVGNPIIDYSFVSKWNTTKVTEMTGMFQNTNIASYVPFTNWDVSKVELFRNMFNQTLGSTVTSLHGLENWNTSSATDMTMMFAHNVSVTDASAIKNWDVSNVTDMHSMFFENFALVTLDLSGWNTSKVAIINRMFYGNSNLKTIYVGSSFSLNSVDTSVNDNVYDMFYGCTKLVGGLGTTYNSNFVNHTYAHIDGGTSNPGYFTDAYAGGTLANGFNLSSPLSTNNIESITFQPNITTPSGVIGSFDASESTDGSVMGYYKDSDSNGKYEVIFASAGKTFAPDNSSYLFANYTNLTTINGIENFSTENVNTMEGMFQNSVITSLDFSGFDTTYVGNMSEMFAGSVFDSIDLSNWNVEAVIYMSDMFSSCYATTIDISGWNLNSITSLSGMFYYARNLTTIYASNDFDIPGIATGNSMFTQCTNLAGDQGTTYSSSHTGKDYAHVDGGTSDPGYFSSGGSSGAKSVNNSMGAKTVSKTSNNITDTSKAILNKIDEIVKKENN